MPNIIKLTVTFFLILAVITVFRPNECYATPTVEVNYSENFLGWGWSYDFTIFNRADPVTDAGFNLWDIMMFFDPNVWIFEVNRPVGWDTVSGSGFFQLTSSIPGLATDGGTDLAPGTSLSGLTLFSATSLANIPFDAYFTNPDDPQGLSLHFIGTPQPIIDTPAVPEPSTILLVGVGLSFAIILRRKLT